MNFDGYLDKMSHLVNEGTLDPDILSKMRDAAPQLISFAKSFDPTSKEEIKILTDTSKLIYDFTGIARPISSIAFLMIRATLSRYACPSALMCVRPRLWR